MDEQTLGTLALLLSPKKVQDEAVDGLFAGLAGLQCIRRRLVFLGLQLLSTALGLPLRSIPTFLLGEHFPPVIVGRDFVVMRTTNAVPQDKATRLPAQMRRFTERNSMRTGNLKVPNRKPYGWAEQPLGRHFHVDVPTPALYSWQKPLIGLPDLYTLREYPVIMLDHDCRALNENGCQEPW